MAPPLRPTASIAPSAKPTPQRISSAYSLELLTEYAHTLDAMPLDLSRIFADLRELDAVLTSTVASVTNKVYKLIEMIEDRSASNEQRLWLLGEIAEEASKVRPGADDKIRIATQAADCLHGQMQHLTNLATRLPEFEPAMLVPKTRYPHVSQKSYMPPHSLETGRRRRAQASGTAWLGGTAEPSPQKKRRVIQDEDLDYGATTKSPRKEKTGETGGQPRPRGGPRTKKVERPPSPLESVHSLTSHQPMHASNHTVNHGRSSGNATSHKNAGQGTTSNKRRANANNSHSNNTNGHSKEGSLLDSVMSRKDNHSHNLAPSTSTSHPSLVDAFDNGKRDKEYWPAESSRELQPGTSKAGRGSAHSSLTPNTNLASLIEGSPAPGVGDTSGGLDTGADGELAGDAADMDGEGDDGKIYCFCNNASFGEMIACDQPGCQREWFHLGCVGLKEAPKGLWYCDECASQRKQPRNPRKKRGGGAGGGAGAGGRANGKNGS